MVIDMHPQRTLIEAAERVVEQHQVWGRFQSPSNNRSVSRQQDSPQQNTDITKKDIARETGIQAANTLPEIIGIEAQRQWIKHGLATLNKNMPDPDLWGIQPRQLNKLGKTVQFLQNPVTRKALGGVGFALDAYQVGKDLYNLGSKEVGDGNNILKGIQSLNPFTDDPVQRQLPKSAGRGTIEADRADYRRQVSDTKGEYAKTPEGQEHLRRVSKGTVWEK